MSDGARRADGARMKIVRGKKSETWKSGVLRLAGWVAAVVLAAMVMPRAVEAHRNGGPNDPCERRIGSSLIHLTLYQPQFDPDAEYCDSVLRQGNTVMVVDVSPGGLRDVPFSVEVLEAG